MITLRPRKYKMGFKILRTRSFVWQSLFISKKKKRKCFRAQGRNLCLRWNRNVSSFGQQVSERSVYCNWEIGSGPNSLCQTVCSRIQTSILNSWSKKFSYLHFIKFCDERKKGKILQRNFAEPRTTLSSYLSPLFFSSCIPLQDWISFLPLPFQTTKRDPSPLLSPSG